MIDRTTFAPFQLHDARETEWKNVRLSFNDWALLHELAGGDDVEGYYLNGYGVEGLVKAAMHTAGLAPEADGIDWNSEGDTCFVHFKDIELAKSAAAAAVKLLSSRDALVAAIAVARENGWED